MACAVIPFPRQSANALPEDEIEAIEVVGGLIAQFERDPSNQATRIKLGWWAGELRRLMRGDAA